MFQLYFDHMKSYAA